MPYHIKKKGECYEVTNKETGRVHARCTTKQKAEAQIRLLHSLEGKKK